MEVIDYCVVFAAALTLFVLTRKTVHENRLWRATVTPLASIIGSGFLIVAPLLAEITGVYAPLAILAIILLAYAIGAVMRFNIIYAEPHMNSDSRVIPIERLEQTSRAALAFAYVISVAFYLRLMSSFVLEWLDIRSDMLEATFTTVILLFLGIVGFLRGLGFLEKLEEYAVSVKLAIIAALLLGLSYFNIENGYNLKELHAGDMSIVTRLQMLAGMLLVVQGFETSRYLGSNYTAEMRTKSMKLAQWISGGVYVAFVVLVLPLLVDIDLGNPDETLIIGLTSKVAVALSALLVVAAVMSQFSAAVADTIGAGGLVEEQTGGRVKPQRAYIVIVLVSILLVWVVDIFGIVSFASRAFAAYYFLQTLIAFGVAAKQKQTPAKPLKLIGFGFLAALLFLIFVFAIPAE